MSFSRFLHWTFQLDREACHLPKQIPVTGFWYENRIWHVVIFETRECSALFVEAILPLSGLLIVIPIVSRLDRWYEWVLVGLEAGLLLGCFTLKGYHDPFLCSPIVCSGLWSWVVDLVHTSLCFICLYIGYHICLNKKHAKRGLNSILFLLVLVSS